MKSKLWRAIISIVSIIGFGLFLFALVTFVVRGYNVDGPSMVSALQNNDRLLVWKLPRTIANITGNQYVPQRGDIVVAELSSLAACGDQSSGTIIKRVIGLPGERVVLQDGAYTIYNRQSPEGFNPDKTLAYNRDSHITTTDGTTDVTLSSNQLFISGDNRPESCDSRDFGPVPTNEIVGKLFMRILPANKITLY